jgi:hypothetical protein
VASKEVLGDDNVLVSESFVDLTCLMMAGSGHGWIWSDDYDMVATCKNVLKSRGQREKLFVPEYTE